MQDAQVNEQAPAAQLSRPSAFFPLLQLPLSLYPSIQRQKKASEPHLTRCSLLCIDGDSTSSSGSHGTPDANLNSTAQHVSQSHWQVSPHICNASTARDSAKRGLTWQRPPASRGLPQRCTAHWVWPAAPSGARPAAAPAQHCTQPCRQAGRQANTHAHTRH